MTPADEIKIGKHIAVQPAERISDICDAMTKVAHVDSANDPNKSDPIPAMSPTLSPTKSAILRSFT